jgi:hypothetical protein
VTAETPFATFPALPSVPEHQRGAGPVSIRYEDVSQTGAVHPFAIPHALGEVLWSGRMAQHPTSRAIAADGAVPILTRIVIERQEGPIAVRGSLEGEGGFQLAHVRAGGEVERVVLNLWIQCFGKRGRSYGPKPEGAGERIAVGRVFAEHVFTRLFAPPEARKVVRLPEPLGVPPDEVAFTTAASLAALPAGATDADEAPVRDAAPIVFGEGHTDSNQHVNSLVYPRLFELAALRRFEGRGLAGAGLPRFVDVGYRKPCFAGDRVELAVRAFVFDGRPAAIGVFAPAGAERPSVVCRMLF